MVCAAGDAKDAGAPQPPVSWRALPYGMRAQRPDRRPLPSFLAPMPCPNLAPNLLENTATLGLNFQLNFLFGFRVVSESGPPSDHRFVSGNGDPPSGGGEGYPASSLRLQAHPISNPLAHQIPLTTETALICDIFIF